MTKTMSSINLAKISLANIDMSIGGLIPEPSFDPSKLPYQAIWTVNGKTNDNIDKNIPNLIDSNNPMFTYNFLWGLGSGYGKYIQDFRTYRSVTDRCIYTSKSNSINIQRLNRNANIGLCLETSSKVANMPSIKLKFTGIDNNIGSVIFGAPNKSNVTIDKDGIYTIPAYSGEEVAYGLKVNKIDLDVNITIEEISDQYGLFFDGIDDRIISKEFIPSLKNYTIIFDLKNKGSATSGFGKENNWHVYADRISINEGSFNIFTGTPIGFNNKGLCIFLEKAIEYPIGNSYNTAFIKSSLYPFPRMIFKFLAIIEKTLNENEIRQTYKYLSTLKANNIG